MSRDHGNFEFSKSIPKLQLEWSTTSYSTFLKCPRRYQYQILEGWHDPHNKVALEFGSAYHAALEVYVQGRATGQDFDECVLAAVDVALNAPLSLQDTTRNRYTLVRTVVWYTEQFANDPLPTVVVDSGPLVEVPFTIDTNIRASSGEQFVVRSWLDRIALRDQQRVIGEYKTTAKTLGESYFVGFSPDTQITLYALGGMTMLDNDETVEIIIDAAQVAVGFSRFERHPVFRKREYLNEFLQEMKYWLVQAEIYAKQDFWPKNEANCYICPFARVCSKSPRTREMWLQADFVK